MKIKKFYNFSWNKLILLILITGIPLFFIMQEMGIKDGPPINIFWKYLTVVLFWPFFLLYYLESIIVPNIDWVSQTADIPFIIIALIINVIYLYSIASLISFIYTKIKSKIGRK